MPQQPISEISKIELPDGITHSIKDEVARFVVNLTWDDEEGTYTADKTYSEIYDAYYAGSRAIAIDDIGVCYFLIRVGYDFLLFSSIDDISVQWVSCDNTNTWSAGSETFSDILVVEYDSNEYTFLDLETAYSAGKKLLCKERYSNRAVGPSTDTYAWLEKYEPNNNPGKKFVFTRVNEDGDIIVYSINALDVWSKTTISNSSPTLTATYTAATYDLEIGLSSAIDADQQEF